MEQCQTCDKYFATPYTLRRHKEAVHKPSKLKPTDHSKLNAVGSDFDESDSETEAENNIDFWNEMVKELFDNNLTEEDENMPVEELIEEPKLTELAKKLIQNVEHFEELWESAQRDPIVRRVHQKMKQLQKTFSKELQKSDFRDLAWEKYLILVKNRIKDNAFGSDSETDSAEELEN